MLNKPLLVLNTKGIKAFRIAFGLPLPIFPTAQVESKEVRNDLIFYFQAGETLSYSRFTESQTYNFLNFLIDLSDKIVFSGRVPQLKSNKAVTNVSFTKNMKGNEKTSST